MSGPHDDVDAAPVPPLDRSAPIWVAGHRGLVGSAVSRLLDRAGFRTVITRDSAGLDLTCRSDVFDFVATNRPHAVVLAAAQVGGIVANNTYPVDFLSRNLQIQVNVMDAAAMYGVERLLFFGSSCIYPKLAAQPIKEEYLLTGPLEPTNEAFAAAKLAGVAQVKAVRRQYGLPWITVMPCNVYGPGDNFSESGSHVLGALIRRFSTATVNGDASVTNWGTGTPCREFIYADDLASASLHLLDRYNGTSPVNVGTGVDYSIANLARMVADAVGFTGEINWDNTKPDGTPRKLLDISLLSSLGWHATTDIVTGIRNTVDWYQKTESEVRC